MIGGALYERNRQIEFSKTVLTFAYTRCAEGKPVELRDCMKKANEDFREAWKPDWIGVAFWALAPILAGWTIVYLTIGTVRWIRAGFNQQGKN
jgi:hypothetical protein